MLCFCLVHAQDRSKTGLVRSDLGPVLDRSDPQSVPLPLFDLRSKPVRSDPILNRITLLFTTE